MRTKRRNINPDSNIYKKKINTRNMNNKNSNDSVSCLSSGASSMNKTSPNTRAKSNCIGKSHSDPYAFSKMDDEDKIPLKRIKVTEKIGKDIGVNTSNLSTMTEPEYLGPCEPGTSIELQGIVWLETATGLLVINVTWRGRTYVGTLMDSTKYEFTPSFCSSQENLSKFDGRPPNRSSRGKKRQVGNPGNHFGLRSNNIRHSRRLDEPINSPNSDGVIKKSSTRQTNNLINYFDSANQSATASASGDSDTDKNSYSKFSTSSKTRSVTRSITKRNKAAESNSNSAEDNGSNMIQCSRTNCFKRFVDMTAYQYHVQRCHENSGSSDGFFHDDATNPIEEYQEDIDKKICIKTEPVNREKEMINYDLRTQDTSIFKSDNCKINGIIKKEMNSKIDSFEFNSDSETEKNLNEISRDYADNIDDSNISENETFSSTNDVKSFIKSEIVPPQLQDLSITLPKVSDNLLNHLDGLPFISSNSTGESSQCSSDEKITNVPSDPSFAVNKAILTTTKSVSQIVSETVSTTVVISHSFPSLRTVTAPTVSIPVELINPPNNITTSTLSSPALIRPKPNQNPITSLIHSSQNRKYKSSKSFSQSESFQIPSSSPVILKKRPLVPLKVAVNQNSPNNVNRMYPIASQMSVTSPNQSSRHIRSSSISPVTPILPATSTLNSCSTSITSTTSTTGTSVSIFHNGQMGVRRPSTTSVPSTGSGLTALVSLKPIQPKPKTSQFPVSTTTSHIGMNTSSYPTSQSIITPSISGLSNIHISHQRQILPSPISKSDSTLNIDESLIHKIESLKTNSLKRKRRKPEKKIRINFHEANRYKKFALNPIQPKHITNDHFNSTLTAGEDFCLTSDKYKTDEENSHSPGYSDLSETNDTPAPILEKEIDLKTGECDKLVICTDFDSISHYCHNNSSDNYDDPKDLSNKPPALMPAVLSSDLVNGSTNELDYREVKPRVSRKKSLANKKTHKLKDVVKGKGNLDKRVVSEWIHIPSSRSSSLATSNRKSFQSSSGVKQTISSTPLLSSPSSIPSLPTRDFSISDPKAKLSPHNRNSITSAINDYVRANKRNAESDRNAINNKSVESKFQPHHSFNEDSGKFRNKSTTPSPNNNNGKFSVQALTSPQEMVSRSFSFATSSTISPIIPNTKLSNALFKN